MHVKKYPLTKIDELLNCSTSSTITNHLMFVMAAANADTTMKIVIFMMPELLIEMHTKHAFLPAQVLIYQMKKSKT